jgi:hypothetical protein
MGVLSNSKDINDKMRPWQDEFESKTVGGMLDNKKLGIRYEK